jgi:cyanate permease
MAGVGLGMAVIPKLASVMILHLGWRAAYVGLGLTIFAVGFFPVIFLLREPPQRALSDGALSWGAAEPGLTAGDAVTGSWRFWALVLAFLLAATAINGTLNSIIALLTDRGVGVGAATSVLAVSGLAAIAGRLVCGFSLDRLFGPYVAIAAFAAPMAGIGVLASGASGAAPLLGAVLCGLGVGAEVDLMPFFASRYFGMAQFGRIYGLMFGAFTIGSGLGPYVMGLAHDRLGSYLPALTALAFALSISCLLMMRLGPYPYPRREAKNGASDRDWPSMPLSARAG